MSRCSTFVEHVASHNKPWQIVFLGASAALASLLAIALLAYLGYALFPAGYGWVAAFHIFGSGVAGFYITRPFIEAFLFRRLLDGWQEITRPPLDVFEEEQ